MGEKASSEFRGLGISRASASVRKEKERRRNALRKILGPDYDSDEDDSDLIRDENLAYVISLSLSPFDVIFFYSQVLKICLR